MAKSGAATARERAREARLALSKKRAEQDKLIEQEAGSFFDAEERAERARGELAAAQLARATAVQELAKLQVADPDIAELLGIEVKEVRSLRRSRTEGLSQDQLPASEQG